MMCYKLHLCRYAYVGVWKILKILKSSGWVTVSHNDVYSFESCYTPTRPRYHSPHLVCNSWERRMEMEVLLDEDNVCQVDAAAVAVVFLIPWALSGPNFANYWRRQGSEGLSQYSFRPTPDHNYVFLLLTFSIFFPSTCTCPLPYGAVSPLELSCPCCGGEPMFA